MAMTGKEALAIFDPNGFDLVLLDIQLPDITGLDISRELKNCYQGRQLSPLIFPDFQRTKRLGKSIL